LEELDQNSSDPRKENPWNKNLMKRKIMQRLNKDSNINNKLYKVKPNLL
jgi:hypothetical protein